MIGMLRLQVLMSDFVICVVNIRFQHIRESNSVPPAHRSVINPTAPQSVSPAWLLTVVSAEQPITVDGSGDGCTIVWL